jgi:opacity protein-like surface antigen
MSAYKNKARFFGVIIILATACMSIVSAQTPGAVNNLPKKPELILETKATEIEKKPVTPAKGTDLATVPEVAKALSDAEDSHSAQADAETTVTVGLAEEVPGPTVKNATTRPQTTSSDEWQFQLSPYFWLASLHGTGGVGNRTAELDVSFGDVFDALNFAFMGTFEARKGRFISLTDLEYVSVSDEKATPGPLFSTVDAGFKIFIFDQEVGYRLLEDPEKGASLDVLGGARVWRVKTDFEFGAGILPATRIEGSRSWVDAVGGLRGKMALSQKIFLTGKFDLGGGGSKFTWQVFAGGGYNVNPKIALIVGYRVLDVDYDKNNFVFDMNQRGPIMGLGFRF